MSPDASPTSESTKAAETGAATVAVTVTVQAATSGTSASPEEKATRTLVVDAETTAAAAPAMEMDDESFHGDATAFTMSLDELADANPPDQLYEDLTGERVKMSGAECTITTTHDHEIDRKHDTSQDHQSPSRQPAESSSQQPPAATTRAPTPTRPTPVKTEARQTPLTPSQPPVATRKSPRRSQASAKASAATTKKAASGTKRGNQSQSPATHAFSWNDILHVQNLIERCLQQLLSKNDIVLTLQAQANVDPSFTVVVWQKLEEQNPAFFKAYAMQLQLKEQIAAFNFLVSQQKEMMAKASGNAAFLSFLASSDARKTQRQVAVWPSRMASAPTARGRTNTPSPHPNTIQLGSSSSRAPTSTGMDSLSSSTSQGFPLPSPLPLPSPMKTDLDTHAFFS